MAVRPRDSQRRAHQRPHQHRGRLHHPQAEEELDSHQVREDLLVAPLSRPDVEGERFDLVDFGDGFRFHVETNEVEVAPAALAGSYPELGKLRGLVERDLSSASTAAIAGSRPFVKAERAHEGEGRAVALRAETSPLRWMPAAGTAARIPASGGIARGLEQNPGEKAPRGRRVLERAAAE